MKNILKASLEFTSNSLAMTTQVSKLLNSLNVNRRRLFSEKSSSSASGEYPSWVSEESRRLLAETPATIKPNAVVAQDGSGQFKTVTDALNNIPKNYNGAYVIHIKAGVYKDYVSLDKKLANVMFIGDGPTKTRITNNKNNHDGVTTMRSATVSIMGPRFIAKDIGFENSAGPEGHQAVALRVQADQAVFFNCHMDGYQDTLYVHAHSQFFRDCSISGTVDFIFGNAAAVFQNCQMIVRKPGQGQGCMVTAQGRMTPNDPTGIVFQNCHIMGEPQYIAVKNVNKAYLGRPWKAYARTVIMQSQIDDVIQPEGWEAWNGDFALNTLYYAEYENRGPGSVQTNRVKWKGIKKMSPQEAESFTVGKFIAEDWVKASGVTYSAGMMKV